jgi:hypothetical protein
MLKAYRYKLEPNQSQRCALARTLDVCRKLYNDCLGQRKLQPIGRYEQSKQLTQLKAEFPVYKNVYSQVLQNVLHRLDKACQSFLRSGFGFPRFKGAWMQASRQPQDPGRFCLSVLWTSGPCRPQRRGQPIGPDEPLDANVSGVTLCVV